MNNTVKNLLVFSAGLVIGGFVSFRLTEEKISDKYETMMQEEIALLKARYDKKKEQLMRDVEDLGEESSATVSVEKKDTTQPIRKAYNKMVKGYGYDKAEGDDGDSYKYEQISREANQRDRDVDAPHIISYEEFNEEMTHYDKLSISFYEDDEVLVDENEEVIVDPVSVVGEEALQSFGVLSEDPEVVYVRNDRLSIDYEIIRLSKSYSETVQGY